MQTNAQTSDSIRPTWVRWRIVSLLMSFSFMNHFNRVSMSVAGIPIMKQFGITPVQMGTVYSAFLIAYTLFMTPGGWCSDRWGARPALVLMGFASAAFCGLTSLAGSGAWAAGVVLFSLIVIRSLMGMFSAPLYPASGRVVAHWIPYRQRALANGLVTGAAPLGIACTYVAFAGLTDHLGWRIAFLITGGITAGLALAWTWYAREFPYQHRRANEPERRLIGDGEGVRPARPAVIGNSHPLPSASPQSDSANPSETGANPSASNWKRLFGNRSLMFLTVSYAAVGYFEYLFFYWMEYYFEEVLQLGPAKSRFYAMIPPLAMVISMPLGGWLSDRLAGLFSYRVGRAMVPIAGMFLSAVLLQAGTAATQPAWIVTWFALALGAVGASEGPFWTTAIELGGPRGSTSAGVCNTGGNAGGILAPMVTPWVGAHFGWRWGLNLGSLVCLVGLVLWCWIDPNDRVRS